jgi:hypothetical protein
MTDQTPHDVDMEHLTFIEGDPPVIPPRLRAGDEIKVIRSYRIPVELDSWLTGEATTRGVTRSDLVRDLLELGRTALVNADRPISLADAIRALTGVRPLAS